MSSFPPVRYVLRPRWWPLHVFTVAVVAGMVFMGRWQWHVAQHHHGDLRNYAYALQWWAFTGFAFLMWWRVIRDSQIGPEESAADESETGARIAPVPYVGYVQPGRRELLDETDGEVRAYNEYLAQLNKPQEDTK